MRLYFFLLAILSSAEAKIYVIGDSHTRAFEGIPSCSIVYLGPMLMHRFGRDAFHAIDLATHGIEEGSIAIYVLGEIDVRCHIGKQRDLKNRDQDEIIFTLANKYIRAILANQANYRDLQSVVCSVTPPQTSEMENPFYPFYGTLQDRIKITQQLNAMLQFLCGLSGIKFLDIYPEYSNPMGSLCTELSDGNVHIDAKYNEAIRQKLYQLIGS